MNDKPEEKDSDVLPVLGVLLAFGCAFLICTGVLAFVVFALRCAWEAGS